MFLLVIIADITTGAVVKISGSQIFSGVLVKYNLSSNIDLLNNKKNLSTVKKLNQALLNIGDV